MFISKNSDGQTKFELMDKGAKLIENNGIKPQDLKKAVKIIE